MDIDFKPSENCVYFLFNHKSNLTKIGITSNLSRRKKELEYQCGVILELIHIIYTPHAEYLENVYHKYYQEFKEVGEFFSLPFEIINFIRKL